MELGEHRNLRDAGKRSLDHVDAHVEGRESEGLREPEAHERTDYESPEEYEREVLVEADVADPVLKTNSLFCNGFEVRNF